jgi:hypothetical protein
MLVFHNHPAIVRLGFYHFDRQQLHALGGYLGRAAACGHGIQRAPVP